MPRRVIQTKRIYETAETSDGLRVLVDRIWPRGVSKKDADVDLWLKELAPSTALRKWFGHQPERWTEFTRRYTRELDAHPNAVQHLLALSESPPITLIYSARDQEHNQARALADYLQRK